MLYFIIFQTNEMGDPIKMHRVYEALLKFLTLEEIKELT